jgi:hypothetical protein
LELSISCWLNHSSSFLYFNVHKQTVNSRKELIVIQKFYSLKLINCEFEVNENEYKQFFVFYVFVFLFSQLRMEINKTKLPTRFPDFSVLKNRWTFGTRRDRGPSQLQKVAAPLHANDESSDRKKKIEVIIILKRNSITKS